MKCQECNEKQATVMITNLAGDMRFVCDECSTEIREKQWAKILRNDVYGQNKTETRRKEKQ